MIIKYINLAYFLFDITFKDCPLLDIKETTLSNNYEHFLKPLMIFEYMATFSLSSLILKSCLCKSVEPINEP